MEASDCGCNRQQIFEENLKKIIVDVFHVCCCSCANHILSFNFLEVEGDDDQKHSNICDGDETNIGDGTLKMMMAEHWDHNHTGTLLWCVLLLTDCYNLQFF